MNEWSCMALRFVHCVMIEMKHLMTAKFVILTLQYSTLQ